MTKTAVAALTLAVLALLASPIPGGIVFAVPLALVALGLGVAALANAPPGARRVLSRLAVSLAAGAVVIAATLTATLPGWMASSEQAPVTAGSSAGPQPPRNLPDESPTQKPPEPSLPMYAEEHGSGTTEPTAEDDRDGDNARHGDRQRIVVTRVVDGDTFEARGLGEGPLPDRVVDVRMLEIDAVERGQCGYAESNEKLARLLGETVTVERDEELKDQYGRWLLYVWSDGVFVNHELVETGYADAALYEPNDKYWQRISAADTSDTYRPWPTCHTPDPQDEGESAGQRDDAYLLPPPPPDRDCGSVSANDFPVRPGDPHNLDADGDGIGCEEGVPEQQAPEDETAGGYPVPPPPPDLDCSEISASNFPVRPGDPHRFDADGDGIGCDS